MQRKLAQLRNHQAEYLVTALGSFFGSVIGALIGWRLAAAYVDAFISDPKFGVIMLILVGIFTGAWIGAVGGCFFGLSWGHYPRAWQTAAILAVIFLPVVLIEVLFWAILVHLAFPAALVTLIGLPLMARYWSNQSSK